MAFGDIGGAVTELIITCRTPKEGPVVIGKGDAVALAGDYTITNDCDPGRPVFGQAMAAATENDMGIPIKVRGICVFKYDGHAPLIDGVMGVVMSTGEGRVKSPTYSSGNGIVVSVDIPSQRVSVLL